MSNTDQDGWLYNALLGRASEIKYRPDLDFADAVIEYSSSGVHEHEHVEREGFACVRQLVRPVDTGWPDESVERYWWLVGSLGSTWSHQGDIIKITLQALAYPPSNSGRWRLRLLRALSDLGHHATVEFWEAQWGDLGLPAAPVIAGALAEINTDAYFRWMCSGPSTTAEIQPIAIAVAGTLATLVKRHGRIVPSHLADHYARTGDLHPLLLQELAKADLLSAEHAAKALVDCGAGPYFAWLARRTAPKSPTEIEAVCRALSATFSTLLANDQWNAELIGARYLSENRVDFNVETALANAGLPVTPGRTELGNSISRVLAILDEAQE